MKRNQPAAPADRPEDVAEMVRAALGPLWRYFPQMDAVAVVISPGGGLADVVIPIGPGQRVPGSICSESYTWDRT